MPLQVDASNSCIPPSCKIIGLEPRLPTTTRGIPINLDGTGGRINSDRPLLVYPSGRLVIVREISHDLNSISSGTGTGTKEKKKNIKAFVYRGHAAEVTVAKFSPSGCYIASGDIKGKLRVWSYDNEEHLCKLDITVLSGPIHDLSWDFESKRIVIVGEGSKSDANSVCTKVIQWDSGVTCGSLAQHTMKKSYTCAFKQSRPMRIVTGGMEDSKCYFNAGPPFKRVMIVEDGKPSPSESCHVRGTIFCVRYNKQGNYIASVGTDKSVCIYNGKTMEMIHTMEFVHSATIYSCSWNEAGDHLLTCSADGTANLISVKDDSIKIVQSWNVAGKLNGGKEAKVPLGAMQMGCAFLQGNIPVTVSLNGSIAILSLTSPSKFQFLTGHQSPISSMAIDQVKGIMYTGDSDGVICSWDVATGNSIQNVQRSENTHTDEGFDDTLMNKVHAGAITGMTFSSTGKLLSIGWDDKLRMTKSFTAEGSTKLDSQPNSIAKGTDLVVIMTVNGLLLAKDDAIISDLIATSYEPMSVCVSSDDKLVFVGGKDCSIYVYSVNDTSLDKINTLTGVHLQPVYALSLSNDGTKLASADVRDICVWNVSESGSCNTIIGKGRWCFHSQKVNVITWSSDGSILASGGNDDSIFLWSLKKPSTRVQYAFAHRDGITDMMFLNGVDGLILASVGNDGCVNKWDVTDDVMKKFG